MCCCSPCFPLEEFPRRCCWWHHCWWQRHRTCQQGPPARTYICSSSQNVNSAEKVVLKVFLQVAAFLRPNCYEFDVLSRQNANLFAKSNIKCTSNTWASGGGSLQDVSDYTETPASRKPILSEIKYKQYNPTSIISFAKQYQTASQTDHSGR